MSFASKVRQMVREVVNQEQAIWNSFLTHSSDYMEVLGLSTAELEVLERGRQRRSSMYPSLEETGEKGFIQFMVEGEEFALAVKHVCGAPYGGSWMDSVMAVCLSNPILNTQVGGGTTLISVVPEEWHSKILQHLAKGNGDETPILPTDGGSSSVH
ncbi:MAG: hypothetical protein A3B91_04800 [Candidatus Yanofskybacteria bacterium RIFCSPHIGHO2_02_FULL_41_29]|uniref:Uncharacterized protein n=1 Tax=Candidatus Yanofskybacteria bacterium RIFCSPHIGHO2_01_FULL_41_53 TaxID=1802663 RepID=A0A1F8EMN5_9BACT|nr:MAG: hypothetical protein A2650_04910 [Candidatus Yanofskybacteria bacterium RIFCSPHIGHO2_01_FULL_41_53]OGN12521.1 MAG: hypothetical protein A3B91_04800 [Candidatus Yanofskybacteria bacterium RIFCSPHIGHO2_02_FULL_41_29]OGN17406.1 MAG: hypothetical protein A3F48_04305 [Candidatus Yanofskybacteria bacterium RIFCSPHIGHO2_12_FULL_41_9]OGN24825.1 MAG: hypothetical protein A2916_04380 [Candidatus Yanofskybacteria bacterium RIFCSPLOWO2_01_FULL_41_67]OGN29017.1 MAG: hypothetical protein A3H54_03400 